MSDEVLLGLLLATLGLSMALVLVSSAAFGRILADLEYQHLAGLNGVRRIQSAVNLRTHGNRVLLGLVFLVLAVLVLMDVQEIWRVWTSRLLLVTMLLAFAASSVCDWLDERRCVRLLLTERRGSTEHAPPEGRGPAEPPAEPP